MREWHKYRVCNFIHRSRSTTFDENIHNSRESNCRSAYLLMSETISIAFSIAHFFFFLWAQGTKSFTGLIGIVRVVFKRGSIFCIAAFIKPGILVSSEYRSNHVLHKNKTVFPVNGWRVAKIKTNSLKSTRYRKNSSYMEKIVNIQEKGGTNTNHSHYIPVNDAT